ncbi:MAG: PEP-CTERM sorting domain-containing protein, partial [Tepidisphaeraceae bacterium]
ASGQNATMGATGSVLLGLLDGATFTNAGTLTGSGGAQFFNDGGAASTFANSGTLDVTGSFTVGSGLTFNNTGVVNVQVGTLSIGAAYNAAPSGAIPVSSGASLKFSGTFAQPAGITNNGSITTSGVGSSGAITGPGSLSITGGTLKLNTNSGVSAQNSLSITGGQLDLNNNHFFINYGAGSDPITTIAGYVKSGYASGSWTGPGIMSTAAQTLTNGLKYGLGYADGKDGKVTGLTSGQIEVKYTLLGDANLDSLVNAADFTILAANFNQPVTSWDQGDFNYDGLVNAADFTDLAANFNQPVSGAASAGDVAALDAFAAANGISLANVPEPTSTAMIVMAGLGILRRRRRR